MKSKVLQRLEILTSALLLTLLLACKPANQTENEQPSSQPAATNAPAAAQAAAPATPAAPTETAKPAAPATGTLTYDAQPIGSKMKMEGTSSIHDWSMESLILGGSIECDAGFPESALTDPKAAKPTVEVFMPVRSFKSNSKRMDEVMLEHMNESKHKRIEYKLIELKPKSAPGSTGALQFDATGALTINGTTKTNTMPVTIEKKDGKLTVTGSAAVKMSDYNVQGPKLTIPLLGSITTGDDLKLTFTWVLAPKA